MIAERAGGTLCAVRRSVGTLSSTCRVATCNGGAWSACSVMCDGPPPGDPPADSQIVTGGCSTGARDDGRAAALVLGLLAWPLRRRRRA